MAFADRGMEERFLSQDRDDTAKYLRWACLVGAAIMIGFIWQDSIITASGYKASVIRFFGALPVSALAWYLSRNLGVRRFISYISAFFWLIYAGFSATLLIIYEPGPYGLTSSNGIASFLLLLLGVFLLSNLRFWASLLVGLLTLLIYTVSVALWNKADFGNFIGGDFLAALVIVIGLAAKTLFSDRARRRLFETSEQLHQSYTIVEQQVRERTTELQVINTQLTAEIDVRKQAEDQLRESENRFRDIAQSMADWIWEIDKNGKYTYISDTINNALGYSAEELIGKTPFELMSAEEGAKVSGIFLKIVSSYGPIVDLENWNLAKDGTEVCLLTNGVPIFDVDGEFQGYRGVDKNITRQKNLIAEKAAIEGQLHQAQKMESIGRLAGGVAHDYNNALSVIIGFTELAMSTLGPTGPERANLDEVLKAAERATKITRQLLAFARKQTIIPKVLDLNDIIEDMLKMLRHLIGEDIDFAWLPKVQLWLVKIDPSQVDQILANLCVNARDAIAGVGKITIETGNITFDEGYCIDHTGFVPGEFVLLCVSDNGCGIDKETLGNIFEPFFTTKEVGKGTGLGLSTVYGIVKQNKGFINVYSEPDEGTTFKIYLPRHEGKAVKIQGESTAKILPGRGETVLLVEDDLSILKLAKKILDGLGYSVLCADTPDAAMGLAEKHTGDIHLLVTDVIMPKMNGRELAERLQSLYPDLKCVFMSGYTANVIAHHGVLNDGVHFIQKPFSKIDLAKTVRKALDE